MGRAIERLGVIGCGLGAISLLVVLVMADREAPRHSVWRDPISWFAADEAPRTDATRAALMVIGASCLVLAAGGWRGARPRLAVWFVGAFGVAVAALALVPVECSLRIDYCEGLVRHRLVSGAHLAHAVIAGVVFVALAALSVIVALRRRTYLHTGVALVTVAATAVMVLAPTNGRIGPLQWVALAGGVSALIALYRPNPRNPRF